MTSFSLVPKIFSKISSNIRPANRTKVQSSAMESYFRSAPQALTRDSQRDLLLKIDLTASYGIRLAWNDLTASQLEKIDMVDTPFLKRALGLPRKARERSMYVPAGTGPFVGDLVTQLKLPWTTALEEVT